MKKVILFLSILLIFSSSILNAFEVKFDEGTFKPFIVNVSVLDYYDNGTSVYSKFPVIDFFVHVDSESFNPYNANIYVLINGNEKEISLDYYPLNSNVPPYYINAYTFAGKIFPQMFGYDFNFDGYNKMLGDIDNITFVMEYKGKKYSYTYSNFSEKYTEFLLTFNNSIVSLDTLNYPQVLWTIDGNIDALGVCLLEGDDEEDIWDNQTLTARQKIDYDSKAYYGNWFNESIPNLLDFSQEQGIMIPGDDYLILKVKSEILADKDLTSEGSSVMRFQAAFKKIPEDKLIPITNLKGWEMLGGGDEEIFVDDFSKIFDLTKVNTIWSWNNNSWSIWSPDQNIMNVIKDYGLEPIHLIYPFHGFWVNFK